MEGIVWACNRLLIQPTDSQKNLFTAIIHENSGLLNLYCLYPICDISQDM